MHEVLTRLVTQHPASNTNSNFELEGEGEGGDEEDRKENEKDYDINRGTDRAKGKGKEESRVKTVVELVFFDREGLDTIFAQQMRSIAAQVRL
jgi:hypothetical protein